MKASEAIEELQRMVLVYGDLEITLRVSAGDQLVGPATIDGDLKSVGLLTRNFNPPVNGSVERRLLLND